MPINYNKDSPLVPQGKPRTRSKKPVEELSILQVLEAAKRLGLSLVIPTSEKDTQAQQASVEKLGIVSKNSPTKAKAKYTKPVELRAILRATHVVSGTVYGPGEIVMSVKDSDLFRSLLQQDQSCIRGHQDTKEYSPVSNCYLIKRGNGLDQYNKYRKQHVSEAYFNSEQAFLDEVGITAGAFDIAGYQPNFNAEGRSF